jgi:hypothetical protein
MSLFISPFVRATSALNLALSGARLYFYDKGTSTPAGVYANRERTVAHTNPVVADSGGMFDAIYLDPGVEYRVRLTTAAGVELGDIDDYNEVTGSDVDAVSPLDYEGVGNGVADDREAIESAIASGKTIVIPNGYTFRTTGGHVIPSNTAIIGQGGTVAFDASGSYTWCTSLGAAPGDTGVAVSNVRIEGVNFTCATDRQFIHFILIRNEYEDVDRVDICRNRITYTGVPSASGDRWFICGNIGGDRTNFRINDNTISGPMQLLASMGNGVNKHWQVHGNHIHNARANSIFFSSQGASTSAGGATLDDISICDNQISADDYTGVGIALGIDSDIFPDKSMHLKNIKIARNKIRLEGSASATHGILIRAGVNAAALGSGAVDSITDAIAIEDNEIYLTGSDKAAIALETVDISSGTQSYFTNCVIRNNKILGGNIYFHAQDGTLFQGNEIRGLLRPTGDNTLIRSQGNIWEVFFRSGTSGSLEWYSSGDIFLGYPASTVTADYPLYVQVDATETVNIYLDNATINSRQASSTNRKSAIRVDGAGTGTVHVRNLSTQTTWDSGLYTRTTGSIIDYTGGEWVSATVDPASVASGAVTVTGTVTVPNAALGDIAEASFSVNLAGLLLNAWVSAANTVSYNFVNLTGGAVDLASGTLRARVIKKPV